MPRLEGRRPRFPRSLLAVPVAALAALFALGVPDAGSGQPCTTDSDCPSGELCGADVCESAGGGCGGEQSAGLTTAENQQEQAVTAVSATGTSTSYPNPVRLPQCPADPRGKDCDSLQWSTPLGWSCQYNDPSVGPTVCTCADSLLPEWLGGSGPTLQCAVRTLDPFRASTAN